ETVMLGLGDGSSSVAAQATGPTTDNAPTTNAARASFLITCQTPDRSRREHRPVTPRAPLQGWQAVRLPSTPQDWPFCKPRPPPRPRGYAPTVRRSFGWVAAGAAIGLAFGIGMSS